MIKHIVFFSVVDKFEDMSKPEILQKMKQDLENLQDTVPALRKIEVGINHPDASEENYDLCLVTEFDDLDGLSAYNIHPEHQKVAAFIGQVRTARACVDYEF